MKPKQNLPKTNALPLRLLYVCIPVLILVLAGTAIWRLGAHRKVQQTSLEEPTPKPISFRFVSLADTKSGYPTLAKISNQISTLPVQPAFVLYEGDVQGEGFNPKTISTWMQAFDGNTSNGIAAKLFLVRGNHDADLPDSAHGWQSFFNFDQIALSVNASNFASMPDQDDLVYSFDYGNAHFVGLDCPGDNTLLTADQLQWLDQDLNSAQSRNVALAFIFLHGPLYFTGSHPAIPNPGLVKIINTYPIIEALFVGHEHVMAYTHLDNTRIPELNHPIEQFVTGNAGADTVTCAQNRIKADDYCGSFAGFATVDVSNSSYSVTFYKEGTDSPVRTWTFIR